LNKTVTLKSGLEVT